MRITSSIRDDLNSSAFTFRLIVQIAIWWFVLNFFHCCFGWNVSPILCAAVIFSAEIRVVNWWAHRMLWWTQARFVGACPLGAESSTNFHVFISDLELHTIIHGVMKQDTWNGSSICDLSATFETTALKTGNDVRRSKVRSSPGSSKLTSIVPPNQIYNSYPVELIL